MTAQSGTSSSTPTGNPPGRGRVALAILALAQLSQRRPAGRRIHRHLAAEHGGGVGHRELPGRERPARRDAGRPARLPRRLHLVGCHPAGGGRDRHRAAAPAGCDRSELARPDREPRRRFRRTSDDRFSTRTGPLPADLPGRSLSRDEQRAARDPALRRHRHRVADGGGLAVPRSRRLASNSTAR